MFSGSSGSRVSLRQIIPFFLNIVEVGIALLRVAASGLVCIHIKWEEGSLSEIKEFNALLEWI